MSVTPSPIGGFAAQFFDNNGVILSGGKIYTYAAGTTTPQITYTSAAGVTAHANPIILDSAGRVPGGEIWLTDGLVYKFVIETATSILLGTYDNITGVNSNFVNYTAQEEVQTATAGQTVFTLTTMNYAPGTNSLTVYIDGVNQYVGDSYLETDSSTVTFTSGVHIGGEVKFTTTVQTTTGAVDASIVSFTGFKGQTGSVQDLAGNDGSDWIGFEQSGTGAIAVSAQEKMREVVSVKDFGAVGDGVTDDTAAIQAAIDYASTLVQSVILNKVDFVTASVYVPSGIYLHTDTIYVKEGVRLYGESKSSSMLYSTALPIAVQLGGASREYANIVIENLSIKGDATTATTKGVYFTRTIRNCYIQQCQIYGFGYNIYGFETWAFTIADNYIHNALVNNIYWSGATSCEISRNRIDDAGAEGIVLDGQVATDFLTVNVSGNAIQGAQYNGLKVIDASNVRVENNFFERNNAAASTYADVLLLQGTFNITTKVAIFSGNFYTVGSAGGTTHRGLDIRNTEQLFVYGDFVRGSAFDKAIVLSSTVGYASIRGVFSTGGSIIDSTATTVLDYVDGNYQYVIGETSTAYAKGQSIKDSKDNGVIVHHENTSAVAGSVAHAAKGGTTNTDTILYYGINSSGTNTFRVTANGDTRNINNVFGSLSDERLKNVVGPAASQWDDIKALEFKKYTFKQDDTQLVQLGLLAQQAEKVSPGLIDTDFDGMKSVKYSVLYLKAVVALQEAMQRIEALEQKIEQKD